ncbi:AraC-like DNA-binding protein [Hymenobacter luteus]|uniref:AraC-like DNA-binding protein n=2 Tax=Hymenobacter TaxID=89966 RepID=A0A7W9WE61_9BACT|nr:MULTISPECIES: AraC family transcriptional regulator [Hymenobacter]MBB4603577.1 AraC-like DNA-binding protein [Hymenobacter latericoloratus]MBB6061250.1 AraC-like DNA-binding protein [Hymenobacter luteus]
MAAAFHLRFFDGGALYGSHGFRTNPHQHYATELILSLGEPFLLESAALQFTSHYALVPSSVEHRFEGAATSRYAFVFLDAQHQWERQLENALGSPSSPGLVDLSAAFSPALTDRLLAWFRQPGAPGEPLVAELVHQLVPASPATPVLDPRVQQSTAYVHERLAQPISLGQAADYVHLSPSRFAHLFTEQVGIPFRRYVLWERLQAAIRAVQAGHSLTQACYEGGFADLPLFTKTFQAMFGVAPSAVIKP